VRALPPAHAKPVATILSFHQDSLARLPAALANRQRDLFVTYRLADSLPRKVVEQLRREYKIIKVQVDDTKTVERAMIRARFARRLDEYLDVGNGECYLRNPAVAHAIVDSWRHFDGRRYRLIAWCVMPNHVHVIFQLARGSDLDRVIHSWKSYTANVANAMLNRSGTFWYREYYDHCIRDERELEETIKYVLDNPAKRGLVDWPFVGCAG
jgi:REP element-mobilizing transposase RayT